MTTTIKTEVLRTALDLVEPGLATKEWIEQSTSFAFINGYVVTYNDEISIRHKVPGIEFTGVVNADEFYRLIQKIDRPFITLEVTDNELLLESGRKNRIRAGFTLHHEVKLPLEEVVGERDWQQLPDDFIEAIKLAVLSVARDQTNPILTCVSIADGFVEGCDNMQLMRIQTETIPHAPFLIPGSAVREIAKYPLDKIDKSGNWIHFLTKDQTTISSRLVSGNYLDTTSALNVQGVNITFPKSIIQILARAQAFASERASKSAPHPLDADVEIKIDTDLLKVAVRTDVGWFEEETSEFQHTGDPIAFIIQPMLLKEVCERETVCVVSDKQIKFQADNWEYVLALKSR